MRRVPLLACLLAAVTSACASSGGVPRPFPTPGSSAPPPATTIARPESDAAAPTLNTAAHGDGYAIVGTALALRGTPYRNGGADPAGFDCSGFVQFVFSQYGFSLPRAVRDQFARGTPVGADSLEPGDLIFFTTTEPGASHVAIAIGGDQFVHAPSERGVVRVENLGAQYWASRFIGAKRVS